MTERYEFSLLTKFEGQTRAFRSGPLPSLAAIQGLRSSRTSHVARIEWERIEQREVGPWKSLGADGHVATIHAEGER